MTPSPCRPWWTIPHCNSSTNRHQLKAADLVHRIIEVSFNQKIVTKATTRVESPLEAWMMASSNNSRTPWSKQVKVHIPVLEMFRAHKQFRELMIKTRSLLMRTTCMRNHQTWEFIQNSSKICLEFKPLIRWAIESKLWGSISNSSLVTRPSSLLISNWTISKMI